MRANEGTADRVVRVLVGLALLSLVALVEGAARWWGLIGLVPLLTGIAGYCPLYALFGFRTCPATAKM
jgi:DUF2892 family protein